MNDKKMLLIYYRNKETLSEVGNILIDLSASLGGFFIDYKDLYFQKGNKGTEGYIESFVQDNKIDIVMFWSEATGFHFSVEFFAKLRKNLYTVMLVGDTEYYFEVRDRYYAQAMDLVVVFNKPCISYYKLIGIEAIVCYSFFDGKYYKKYPGLKKDMDVSFVGLHSCHSRRLEYLEYLKANAIPAVSYGPNSVNGPVSAERLVEIINKTKINLNFTDALDSTRLTRNLKVHKLLKQPKGRITQAALCGGFVLSEYAYGIEDTFEIGKEIDVFYSKDDLLEKVRHYLKNYDKREAMALSAYKKAVELYDGNKGIPQLFNKIKEMSIKKRQGQRKLYLDKVFIANYSTFRVLLIIKFLKRLQLGYAVEEFLLLLKCRKLDLYQVLVFIKEEIIDNIAPVRRFLNYCKRP
ncbi:MAG: glycosyltransferase [Elusimicrobia bacterium]|nr:glycosyltransferase [Candidatus Liberimonas magnetica]